MRVATGHGEGDNDMDYAMSIALDARAAGVLPTDRRSLTPVRLRRRYEMS